MSSTDDTLGLSDDDKQRLVEIMESQKKHTAPTNQDPDRPNLPLEDGEPQVLELRGNRMTKVHRPDPERDETPWCQGKLHGFDAGSSVRAWKYRPLSVAREWRDPCKVCFPEGYDE